MLTVNYRSALDGNLAKLMSSQIKSVSTKAEKVRLLIECKANA